MGDEVGCVNVASKNMLSFPGSDGETVGNVSDVAVEVGTPSSDFGEDDGGEEKEPIVADVLDFQYYNNNESRDKDTCRKTSPVEILRRNFGIPKSSGDNHVETPRELNKVDSMLENLDHHRRLPGNPKTPCSSSLNVGEGSHSEFPDFLELEDPELPVSEVNGDSRISDDRFQSKEHVYCTVYCIANDNYRKPSDTTLSSDHESPSPSDLSVLPPTDSSNSDPDVELDQYPEAYTLNDLVDPPMLNNVLYMGNILLQCRVCLVVRSIRSLHCCKKPVCEECMKTYISSQVPPWL